MKRDMYRWLEQLPSCNAENILPIITYPGLQLIGKKVIDVITSAENQFNCINAIASKYPTAAFHTIMDLSVEAEAFGCQIRFSDNEAPEVQGQLVFDTETINKLAVPDVGAGRTPVYLGSCKMAVRQITDRPILGGSIGPCSLAGRLMSPKDMMVAMFREPKIVHALLEKCSRFIIDYIQSFKLAGANGVIIAEPTAGLLSPAKCDEFSSCYVKKIVEATQDENFIVILHNCGDTLKLVKSMLSTGAKGLHFGNKVDMTTIMPQIPDSCVAFGNIDPVSIFKNGTEADIKKAVTNLLGNMKPFPNFVLSSGCDVPPGTPLKNVDAFFEAVISFRQQENKLIN
jgi:uroporphyrinogen decarboxylase